MLYIDDADDGLSPDTSHPRFVELAPASFYDEGDSFAPFGNDDGNDTLRSLEEWFSDAGAEEDPISFLRDLLEEWGMGVPADVPESTPEELRVWAGEDAMNEAYAAAEARARIATALGALKIVGRVSSSVLAEGERGARVLRLFAEDTTRDPDWPHRGAALRGLDEIDRVLENV